MAQFSPSFHATSAALTVPQVAAAVRRRVLEHTLKHNGGYLSQACSSAEILATLYLRVMRLGASTAPALPRRFAGVPAANNPHAFTGAGYNGAKAPDLDRFIFSPVHYALVLYSVLIELGRLAPEALDEFNRDGSTVELIGAEHSPGHEVTAGSLAQALSQAGGIALARRLRGESGRVWVFMSDGEFQEGQTWEALAALAQHRLGNVGIVIDANAQQCDGPMAQVMSIEPLAARLRAFGAEVHEVDGHDPEALEMALKSTQLPDLKSPQPPFFKGGLDVLGGVEVAAPFTTTRDQSLAEKDAAQKPPLEKDAAQEPPLEKGGLGGFDRPLVVIARTDPCHGLERLRERAPKLHYVRFKPGAEYDTYQRLLAELTAEAN